MSTGIGVKQVIILGWENLPKSDRDWFIEYHGKDDRTNTFYKLTTELPSYTLKDINLMREHMSASWKMPQAEIETDIQLLEYLTDHGDHGAFIYRALSEYPDIKLDLTTMFVLDGSKMPL
tara:strand:- start:960 stop:1319 length:360 start_codon:yes stop_codon:yes gene_type:complete